MTLFGGYNVRLFFYFSVFYFSYIGCNALNNQGLSVLECLPLLPSPALLWDGVSNKAVVCFAPIAKKVCWNKNELSDLPALLKADADATTASMTITANAQSNTAWSGFRSGWLGYFSYEAGHCLIADENRLPEKPLAEFFEYEFSLLVDLTENSYEVFGRSDEAVAKANEILKAVIVSPTRLTPTAQTTPITWSATWNKAQYEQAFAKVQHYLQSGDCYQVNLAMPFNSSADLRKQQPLPLLQSFNPAFGGYLSTEHVTLFSVSPERFISVTGNRLETRPIKGTVARGKDAAEDLANKEWLAASGKNQAENLMIVDLLRNDLSRYALPHSVKVEKLFAIESHANVHHMVSTISATKRDDISAMQVMLDALPGGSITGAPKKRAMEIINELEAGPRSAYCGVMGYFDDAGFADFNILIRTIVATQQGAQCWAGGGVVLDSTCEEEWQELHTKVARILEEF